MVRRGARLETIRRFGTPLPGLTRKEVPERQPAGRGAQRGAKRKQKSDYGRRLEEKQKVRFHRVRCHPGENLVDHRLDIADAFGQQVVHLAIRYLGIGVNHPCSATAPSGSAAR